MTHTSSRTVGVGVKLLLLSAQFIAARVHSTTFLGSMDHDTPLQGGPVPGKWYHRNLNDQKSVPRGPVQLVCSNSPDDEEQSTLIPE